MTDDTTIGIDDEGAGIRLDARSMAQGMSITGPSASGKTTLMATIAAGAMAAGRGLVFVDGKADPRTTEMIGGLAHALGRSDDVLIMDLSSADPTRETAGWNPFARGTAESIRDLIAPSNEQGSQYWQDRARRLSTALMPAIVYLREANLLDVDAGAIQKFLNLRMIVDLVDEMKFPDLPGSIRSNLLGYLITLPGFDMMKGYRQGAVTIEQHTSVANHFMGVLAAMADDHVGFPGFSLGDVDMADVRNRGRILIVTLPPAGSDRASLAGRIAGRMLSRLADGCGDVSFVVLLDEVTGHDPSLADSVARVPGVAIVASERVRSDAPRRREHSEDGLGVVVSMGIAPWPSFTVRRGDWSATGRTFDLSDLEKPPVRAHPGCVPMRPSLAHDLMRVGEDPLAEWSETAMPGIANDVSTLFPQATDRVDATDAARRATAVLHVLGKQAGRGEDSPLDFEAIGEF